MFDLMLTVLLCILLHIFCWFLAKSHAEGKLEPQIDDAKWERTLARLDLRKLQGELDYEKAKADRLIQDLRHLIEEYEADSREDNE